MKFEVIRGTARHEGAFHRKGSLLDAEADEPEIQRLVNKGVISPIVEKTPLKKPKISDES